MNLLDELKKDIYWTDTYEKMRIKRNFHTKKIEELDKIVEDNFKDTAIELIEKGKYIWSTPEKHKLNKIGTTKKRVVYIYSMKDRYLLGVLYRVCSAYFSDRVSEACFSYKSGVRTLSAIEYLLHDPELFNKKGVKLDISAYFNSVKKDYLSGVVDELFITENYIHSLISGLLFNDAVMDGGKLVSEYKGLIPGTALASFFANYCLKDLDNYISGDMGVTYARYSDDIILFDFDESKLQEYLDLIGDKLKECGLAINPTKYEWYTPGDEITYLGLKVYEEDGKVNIDISENSKRKMKAKIRKSTKYLRKKVEMEGKDPYKCARDMLKRYNHRVYKCYIEDKSKYGWAYYAFRYINNTESIREIDYYVKDRVRYLITGKNNSANIRKVPNQKLEELGYKSLVDMYKLFLDDFDVYCDEVYLIK